MTEEGSGMTVEMADQVGHDGGRVGDDGGDGRSGPAMTRTDRHCRLDRQSQKDYLYIRKTIGHGAEGICVFYDEWE